MNNGLLRMAPGVIAPVVLLAEYTTPNYEASVVFDLTKINIPKNVRHLRVLGRIRGNATIDINVTFAPAVATCYGQAALIENATVTGWEGAPSDHFRIGAQPVTSYGVALLDLWVLNPFGGVLKTVYMWHNGYTTSTTRHLEFGGGSTGSVPPTSFTIYPTGAGTFAPGTKFTLLGYLA